MTKQAGSPLERVIYEVAQELAGRRKWTLSFALSVMWSTFESAGELENAQTALLLMQRGEERKGKEDPIFTDWRKRESRII
jgi:hypothetical protein